MGGNASDWLPSWTKRKPRFERLTARLLRYSAIFEVLEGEPFLKRDGPLEGLPRLGQFAGLAQKVADIVVCPGQLFAVKGDIGVVASQCLAELRGSLVRYPRLGSPPELALDGAEVVGDPRQSRPIAGNFGVVACENLLGSEGLLPSSHRLGKPADVPLEVGEVVPDRSLVALEISDRWVVDYEVFPRARGPVGMTSRRRRAAPGRSVCVRGR